MTENLQTNQSKNCCFQKIILFAVTIILLIALAGIFGPLIGAAGIIFIGYLIIKQFFDEIKDN